MSAPTLLFLPSCQGCIHPCHISGSLCILQIVLFQSVAFLVNYHFVIIHFLWGQRMVVLEPDKTEYVQFHLHPSALNLSSLSIY